MPRLPRFRLLTLLLSMGIAGCARLPAEDARGSPAAAVARTGFAAISAYGLPLGAAVAIAPDRLLTSAHILPAGDAPLVARRGDDAASVPAMVLARSARLDLAVLGVAPGVFDPVAVDATPVLPGERLWAIGAPAAGPAMAAGVVAQPDIALAGRGPGFTARIGALMGYSGGPVVDEAGRLRGLTTALLRPGAAPILAALTGFDLDGLSRSGEVREVFILSIVVAMGEFGQIAPDR